MVRKSPKPQLCWLKSTRRPRSMCSIVTARPNAERDVGYRTITRPLIEALKRANLKVAC